MAGKICAAVGCNMNSYAQSDVIHDNTLMYIAGYVCRTVLGKHNCDICRSAMLKNDTSLLESRDLFCAHRAYNNALSNFGSLKAASEYTFQLLNVCEQVFVTIFV